jgi:acetylornithine deacetylase/succinyl-diaminopimelate desuccinylase-like protein
VEKDGWLYGRGAVDMKNMVAMCCHVLLALKEEGVRLKRDVIFAAVADEETGSGLGSRFLVDHHPDLVRAEYALGEVGAFPLDMGPVRYFPIMVAEKGAVRLTLTATGDPGHGSVPHAHQAVVHLARALAALSARRLPVRVTDPVRRFVEVLAATQPLPSRLVLPLLTSPTLAGPLVDKVLPAAVRPNFAAMLSNTATPTVLSAGGQVNVIPSTATARVDGRTLPGQTAADLVAQVRSRVGPHVGIQVDSQEPPLSFSPDTPLYAHLARVLRQADPACVPVPYMLSGFTDAKSWARLGTTCYGFAPTRFPPGSAVFGKLFHGHDERAHVEGFRWGFNVLRDAVRGWVT